MQQITFDIAALCDKAGRKANQDNFFLGCRGSILQVETEDHAELLGEKINLPPEGTMLLVADGMGGMNAGEVASQIVVDTISHEMETLAGQEVSDAEQASAFARRAIADADKAIKDYVAAHPEASGTGSTVVLLWLLGDKAVVAWCGDSRCYRYNPRRGLEQLSHDHSYVQQLVDEGKLAPEMAFGHDQSNIITRCLCDDAQPAEPDIKVVDVYRDDLFLLCSDGLCGLLPDAVTEQLVRDAGGDVAKALAGAWRKGASVGWSDNVSIIFASVDGIEAEAPERVAQPLPPRPSYTTVTVEPDDPACCEPEVEDEKPSFFRRHWLSIVLLLLTVAVAAWLFAGRQGGREEPQKQPVQSEPQDKPKPTFEGAVPPDAFHPATPQAGDADNAQGDNGDGSQTSGFIQAS